MALNQEARMMSIRVACHVHSNWSYDGKWSLEKLAETFSRRGYRALLTTEHSQGFDEEKRLRHRDACARASSEKFLIVPGIEYSDPSNTIHLLVWGNVPFVGPTAKPDEVLTAVRQSGGVTVFAHPSRKEAWKKFDPQWRDSLLGIEFWNRKTDGWAPSPQARELLRTASSTIPFAGMDFHDPREFFPMVTLLDVQGPPDEQSVLESLKSGRCRSTVFGLEAADLQQGIRATTFRSAENLRRTAARLYRAAIRKPRKPSTNQGKN